MAGSLVGRVLSGYGGVRASFRAEAARISEARLLFYAMLGGGLIFLARMPVLAGMVPAQVPAADFLGAQFVSHVFFLPLALYGLAALSRLGARAFGGTGGWQAGRLALFWALLLAVPLVLAVEAATTALGVRGTSVGVAVATAPWIAYLWFWAVCLAESEGFTRPGLVFAGLLTVPLAGAGVIRLAAMAG
jgi:hypothetical protein